MNTKRILIIEDDRDAANVLEAYLRRENFGVILA
ncbi:DNA-binding response regulator, partial [Klebsiella pneumoniae]